jgi:hypothetical protein
MFLTNYTGGSGTGDLVLYNNNNPTIYMPAASTYVGIGTATPSQKLTVHNGTTTGTYTTTGWVHSSDERLKTNITSIDDPLQKVLQLNDVYFNWKTDPVGDRQMGFIAQDVKSIVPEVVVGNEKDGYGLAYGNLTALLVGAVQQQQEFIQTNTNNLTTKAPASTVTELQKMTDDQFTTISGLLRSTRNDDETLRDDILELQVDVNAQADLLTDLQMNIDSLQAGVSMLTTLSAIDALKFSDLLAIDPDKIVVADGEGDVTISGVVAVKRVETTTLVITGEEKGAMIGSAAIAEDAYDVFVPTIAVEQNSRIFITPKRDVVTQILSVTRIDEHSGFHVTVADPVKKPLEFDWMIVEDNIIKDEKDQDDVDLSKAQIENIDEKSNEQIVISDESLVD